MAALTAAFWSLETHSYWLEFYSQSFPSGVIADIVKCIILSVSTTVLAGKSVSILKLLRQRRTQVAKGGANGIYAVTSLVLFALFVIGTILYCTKVLLSLKEVMCAVATWDTEKGDVKTLDWIKCRGVIRNGYIHDTVDKILRLVFAVNAQIVLSIVNGILVYRVRNVFSDMWMVYVPFGALYVLWVVISFVEVYTILTYDWRAPDYPLLFQLTFHELKHLVFALSFVINLLATIAIATRRFLELHGKSTVPEGGKFPLDKDKRQGYNEAKILLVDAALPVTLCSFGLVIAYSRSVLDYTNTAVNIQGIFAILWLVFSVRALLSGFLEFLLTLFAIKVMAPHLIAIHNLRAEAREFARKAEMVVRDKLRDSSLDMDIVAVKTLAYSQDEPAPGGELKV
ncbi:hypothetical protein H1R20_g13525, partial [Candolleomyces eurysporus]